MPGHVHQQSLIDLMAFVQTNVPNGKHVKGPQAGSSMAKQMSFKLSCFTQKLADASAK